MADDDASWDAVEFEAPPLPTAVVSWAAEEDFNNLKENWDDPDETEKPPEDPPEIQKAREEPKKKLGKVKKKGADKSPEESTEADESGKRKLTGKELEELQKKRDMELIGDMFGQGHSENNETSAVSLETEDDFKNFADKLGERLRQYQRSDHYKAFLSQLFYKLCSEMDDPVGIRKLGAELTALGNLIQENARKAKQEKEKKKQKVNVKPGSANILDDVIDIEEGGGYGMEDDEDFI